VTGVALRGLGERKLRSVLTALAVLLGVAMIAGTYVLTDQMRGGFTELNRSVYGGVDVEVSPKEAFTSQFSAGKPLSERLIDEIRAVPGVAKAEGDLWASGALVVDGELKKSTGGGGTIIGTASTEPFKPVSNVDGRMPERSGEVALLRDTADKHGLEPGDSLGIATRDGTEQVTVVGSYDLGSANAGGTDLVSAPLADIQRWFDREGEVTTINVAAEEGVAPEELVRRVRKAVPAGLEVRTGAEAADETADEISDQIGRFLTPALLAFAGAALLVGAFIIFNTFTITVAERTREFALLRTLGATRGQVLGAVALEALVIGACASLLGLLLGLGFAKVLAAMFEAVGLGLPTAGAELAPRTIALSLGVGIGVTQLAALAPARRATRVPPVAALQGHLEPEGRRRRWAPWIAAVVAVLGVGMMVAGLFAGGPAASRLSTMAGGVVLLFVGVALSARWFVRPLAGAVGWPLERLFAEPGLLARENAMRNPGRTATTAAALMVGLGLVVFVAVFANGIKASFDKTVEQVVGADLVVRSDTLQPIPAGASSVVARSPDVSASTSVLIDQLRVNGKSSSSSVTDFMNGVVPANLAELYRVDWVEGDDATLGRLRGDTALIEEQFSKAHGVDVGDTFRIETPSGGTAELRTLGIYRDPQLLQGTIVPQDLFDRVSAARDPWMIFAATREGVGVDVAKRHLAAALADIPTAAVESQADYAEAINGQLDQFVYLLYALLAMSVVISLFGIANSLFLSIHERTREFGLLRAVGATKAQVRRMVRYESVITAVIGGLLGTAIGVMFAYLVTSSLDDLGLGFDPPLRQLGIFLLLAVVVGVLAAVVPARRGARLQVLEALRAE
jgi:putative ABC transport system permease protein